MSLSQDQMMDLMAYADGELEGDEHARVEELVRTNDDAKRVVDAMRGIGDVVRALPEAAEKPIAIVDDVMARIEKERGGGGEVISLSARRARFGVAVTAVLAIAAGVAVYLRSNATQEQVATDVPHETAPVVQPAPGSSAEPAPATSVASNTPPAKSEDVDLQEVESATHTMSVFYVPKSITGAASANAGAASVVIWIDDHGGH